MVSRTEQVLRREKMEATLPSLIDLFVATKKTEGKSRKTVTWYSEMLDKFSRFVGTDGRIQDITLDNGRAFVAHLQDRTTRFNGHPKSHVLEGGLSIHTIHGYVRALKVFGTWLQEEGFLSKNPFVRLKRPKLPETIIEILSDEEIQGLLAHINPHCFLGARMLVVVSLLLDTGIRATELITLTIPNTDLDNDRIKVMGKGSKERIVPFGATAKKALLRYVTTWRPKPTMDKVDNLILSVDGLPLTYDGLAHLVKRLGERSGIPRLHAHLFRHTFAVNYLMNGGDVMTLKMILGHTSLDVTQVYMHLAASHVQLQHAKFSPLDRLGARTRKKA
jgi:site-specific recombinase XerD